MDVIFLPNGWQDYQYWIDMDIKHFRKINKTHQGMSANSIPGNR
jgi:Txe/YoeB family toxin of Txe-Axe toxin-antitoxin module